MARALRSLWQQARMRLGAAIGTKVAVLLGLAVGICVPYFGIQQLRLVPLRSMPETALDRWIPFEPGWAPAYLSIALLVPLAPLLAPSREALLRYARGLAGLCVPAFVCFLVFPVEGPRPLQPPDDALYRWIVSTDAASNSVPSLHAGLVAYSLLFASRVLRPTLGTGTHRLLVVAGMLWGGTILYATLATRQHWAVDLPAGILLAGAAHALAWRETLPRARRGAFIALATRPGRPIGARAERDPGGRP